MKEKAFSIVIAYHVQANEFERKYMLSPLKKTTG